MLEFIIDTALVREYQQLLENILPYEIDGLESEGEMMVQYFYIRGSIEFEGLVNMKNTDPLTPHISMWKYIVRS
ncbi:MAG TPA: hypothetical protein VEP90_16850, partial [Methylomirabilota bacterium]|nr:hypothetical protein [Methylomirabilota bacterium]